VCRSEDIFFEANGMLNLVVWLYFLCYVEYLVPVHCVIAIYRQGFVYLGQWL